MANIDREIIPTGRVINNYEIAFLVGRGGFGDVYKVKDKKTSQMFALKTEDLDAPVKSLNNEVEVLKSITGGCFPKLRSNGTEKKYNICYLVMNILGASIGLIRRQHNDKLDLKAAFPIAAEMLRIIEKFHSFGFVHRDIKPSNFLTQQNPNDHLVLIDFGLTKKHIDPETNEPFPFKDHVKFTGTKKYASPNAHRKVELGRVDDLFSWFYSFLEIANGNLPWNEIKDNEEMLKMKTETIPIEELVGSLPHQIVEIHEYLSSLKYESEPDYKKINKLLNQAMDEAEVNPNEFNWSAFYSAHANLGDLSKSLPPSRKSTQLSSSKPHTKKSTAKEDSPLKDNHQKGKEHNEKKPSKKKESGSSSESESSDEKEGNCCNIF